MLIDKGCRGWGPGSSEEWGGLEATFLLVGNLLFTGHGCPLAVFFKLG